VSGRVRMESRMAGLYANDEREEWFVLVDGKAIFGPAAEDEAREAFELATMYATEADNWEDGA